MYAQRSSRKIAKLFPALSLLFLLTSNLFLAKVDSVQAAPSFSIIATIPVGTNPSGIAVIESTNRIYATNYADSSVSVIDGSTNSVIMAVPLSGAPSGIGVNPATNKIYVANKNGDLPADVVSVIDGSTNTVIKEISVAINAFGVAVNPVTNRIYVTTRTYSIGQSYVEVIDGNTDTLLTTILSTVEHWAPSDVDVNTVTNRVYVRDNNSTAVIDGSNNLIIASIPVSLSSDSSFGIAVNASTNKVYLVNDSFNGPLHVIDGSNNSIVQSIDVPPTDSYPISVGVNANTNHVFVSSFRGTVSVFDGSINAFIDLPIQVGGELVGVAVNQNTGRVYMSDQSGNRVVVIEDNPLPPPDDSLAVSVDVTGNFFSFDEDGNHIKIDDQRYASLPIRVQVRRGGLPAAGAVVSVSTHPFEKVLGVTDANGIVVSAIDSIPAVLSEWLGSQEIEVVASDATGSGTSGAVEIYDVLQSPIVKIPPLTSEEVSTLRKKLLFQYASRPGLDSLLCGLVETFGYCDLVDTLHTAVKGLTNYGWEPEVGDEIENVLYTVTASGQADRYFTRVSVIRDGDVIMNDLAWWTRDPNSFNFSNGPNRRLLRSVIASPATLYITDPSGKNSGTNPDTGQLVFEFDMAVSDVGDEPYLAVIPKPMNGEYKYKLIGTGYGPYTLSIGAINDSGMLTGETVVTGTTEPGLITEFRTIYDQNSDDPPIIAVTGSVDYDPNTLYLKSKSDKNAFTAYIELPKGLDISQIDKSSILLESSIPALSGPISVGDHDLDGNMDLTVKFNKQSVINYLKSKGLKGQVVLTVSGKLQNELHFAASNVVNVIK